MDFLDLIDNLDNWKIKYEILHEGEDSIYGIKIVDKFSREYTVWYIADLFDKTCLEFDSFNIDQPDQSLSIIMEGESIYFTKTKSCLKAVITSGKGNNDFHYYNDVIISLDENRS